MNLRAFFYQQAVAMVAFSYVGYSSKTFSALPLDIHQPLFVFTDPTMYEWSLAVPLCFSAIFTSKALINQHFQGKGQKEKNSIFFTFFILVTGFGVYIRQNFGGIFAQVLVCFQSINHVTLIFITTLVG